MDKENIEQITSICREINNLPVKNKSSVEALLGGRLWMDKDVFSCSVNPITGSVKVQLFFSHETSAQIKIDYKGNVDLRFSARF